MQIFKLGKAKIYLFNSVDNAAEYCLKKGGVWISCNAELLIKIANNLFVPSPNESYYLDGIGANLAIFLKYGIITRKIPGCELWIKVISHRSVRKERIAIVGGTQSVNERVTAILKNGGFNVCYSMHGYFSNEFEAEVAESVISSRASILIVALGQPRQEIFARLIDVKPILILPVGGSLDLFVGDIKRAPKLLQNIGLEWLYRLLVDPGRFIRYLSLFKLPFIIRRL